MKALALLLIFSIIPLFSHAEGAPSSSQNSCTMEVLKASILTRAKGSFEALVSKSLKEKFGAAADFKISEDLLITKRENKVEDNNDTGREPRIDTDYFLTISNIKIVTTKGNILTLNASTILLHSEGPTIEKHYDDEGVFTGKSCTANFIESFDPLDAVIVNAATRHPVAKLNSDSLSVSAYIPLN